MEAQGTNANELAQLKWTRKQNNKSCLLFLKRLRKFLFWN